MGRAERRHHPEEEAGGQGDRQGKEQHGQVQADLVETRQGGRRDLHQQADPGPGQENP